jgi:hypothetical protein
MGQPFKTIGCEVLSKDHAAFVVSQLLGRRAWFEVMPLLDDEWYITTKPENRGVFPEHSDVEEVPACPGCS